MSGTILVPPQQQAAQTTAAVAIAQDGAQLLSAFQIANPPLYAQMVGSLATYAKSASAPLVGSLLGLLVAHYGLGPYVTPDILNLATEGLVALGTGTGALAMHWWSKSPARALLAPSVPAAAPLVRPATAQEIAAAVVEQLKLLPHNHPANPPAQGPHA